MSTRFRRIGSLSRAINSATTRQTTNLNLRKDQKGKKEKSSIPLTDARRDVGLKHLRPLEPSVKMRRNPDGPERALFRQDLRRVEHDSVCITLEGV